MQQRLTGMQTTSEIAFELALAFSDETRIPARFRPGYSGKGRFKPEANIEAEFTRKIESVETTIAGMLAHMEPSTAWRIILGTPESPPGLQRATDSADFQAMNDYLIHRRDVCACDPDELGCLCSLMGALQAALRIEPHS